MKISNLISRILDRFLEKRIIVNCEREPYLHRWYLFRSKPLGIFIHRFVRSDEDRALHDHPWPFMVIPLWRGYREHNERHECWLCGWRRPRVKLNWFPCFACGVEGGTVAVANCTRVYPIHGTRLRPATYRHRVELMPCDHPFCRVSISLEEPPAPDCSRCAGSGFLPAWSLFIRFTEWRTWGFWILGAFVPWNTFWQEKCE